MHAVPANARATGWIACLLLLVGCTPPGDSDWPAYGGDAGKTRHSPLTQINRDNVGDLALAWSYDTGEKGDTQTQPIVIGGVLYAYTPTHKTIALDAATGQLLKQGRSDKALGEYFASPIAADGIPSSMRACPYCRRAMSCSQPRPIRHSASLAIG